MAEQKTKRQQKAIDLKTKLAILQDVDKAELNKTSIAQKYNIPKSTLSTIIKNRNKIEESLASGSQALSSKRMRTAKFEDVEFELQEWFAHVRASNLPVSGPIIQKKAKEIALKYDITDFDCSSGWLWRFQKRHGIVSHEISGEAAKVNETTVADWLSTFEAVRKSYLPKDIFNMDETGLFYNLLPNRTLDFKGKRCHGGAKSKQRLTVVLCCNSDGSEKHKAWVIGKAENPRCFKNFNKLHLPCEYTSHKSSWIDSKAFREWLLKLNRRMVTQHRNILLTLDNCAAHKGDNLELSNIKLYFFPANTTSHLQPLDQGIIANLKSLYKTRLLSYAIRRLENEETVNKWDVLQAIRAISAAWNAVSTETIKKCFDKAWAARRDKTQNDLQELQEAPPEEWAVLNTLQPLDVTFQDFLEVDTDLSICPEPSQNEDPQTEHSTATADIQHVSSDESDEEVTAPSKNEVMSALSILHRFAATSEVSEKFDSSLHVVSSECTLKMRPVLIQKSISDFFTNL